MTSLIDPYESLGFHCNLTMKAFLNALEDKLKGSGVSQAQFHALAYIKALGPLSQSELAERLWITPATTVRLVDRMVRDGWVVREVDSADRRVKMVTLTEKATEVWNEISQMGREMLDRAYSGVHPSEIETVKRVLARVRENLKT